MKSHFQFVILSGLIVMSMLLGACATKTPTAAPTATNSAETNQSEATTAPVEQTTIKVMSFFAFDTPGVEYAVVKAFEEKNPDITVVFESVPYADIFLKYKTLIAAGLAPDVMSMNYDNAYMFAS
ncbi:MAG: extracellular solute-binding protein, partial [Chloroflexi bacterium]|nr:extracellular solute-binding protein [Chloroflexota bacterium]